MSRTAPRAAFHSGRFVNLRHFFPVFLEWHTDAKAVHRVLDPNPRSVRTCLAHGRTIPPENAFITIKIDHRILFRFIDNHPVQKALLTGKGMEMNAKKKNDMRRAVADMGLPPLLEKKEVELAIQEYRAKARWVIQNYPSDRVPKVGDDIQLAGGTIKSNFVVTEVRHLLLPRAKNTVRAVLLLVKSVHHV